VDLIPLGSYHQFADLTGKPRAWGAGTVAMAGQVVDDLVRGIREFAKQFPTRFPSGHDAFRSPVVLGAVPWLTEPDVVDALVELSQGSLLLVVDKGSARSAEVLRLSRMAPEVGFAQGIVRELEDMAPLDEHDRPPVIGPTSGLPGSDRMLGPVRVIGWQRPEGSGTPRPLLHSKVLVLAVHELVEGMGEFGEDVSSVTPVRTWIGSANWTKGASRSLEIGLWSDDRQLAAGVWEYLVALVKFSEPIGSAAVGPEPELVPAVWDDEAFAEYAERLADADEDENG
jgi:hypothetical protein